MELREKDTRKVVAGLKCCADNLADCDVCYLYGENGCYRTLAADAVEHIEEIEKELEYFSKKYNETCIELTKERENKWISVEDERKPNGHNELCLVYREGGSIGLAVHYGNSNRHYWSYDDVTHWMPLPEPPKPKEPTFKDVFLKAFPKVQIDERGIPRITCCTVFPYLNDGRNICQRFEYCYECWNQPYFEPQEEGGKE